MISSFWTGRPWCWKTREKTSHPKSQHNINISPLIVYWTSKAPQRICNIMFVHIQSKSYTNMIHVCQSTWSLATLHANFMFISGYPGSIPHSCHADLARSPSITSRIPPTFRKATPSFLPTGLHFQVSLATRIACWAPPPHHTSVLLRSRHQWSPLRPPSRKIKVSHPIGNK